MRCYVCNFKDAEKCDDCSSNEQAIKKTRYKALSEAVEILESAHRRTVSTTDNITLYCLTKQLKNLRDAKT